MLKKNYKIWGGVMTAMLLLFTALPASAQESGSCQNCQNNVSNTYEGNASFSSDCDCPDCRGRHGFGLGSHLMGKFHGGAPHRSPGHGWTPPARVPVPRRHANNYQKYWPSYWSGNGYGPRVNARPVVYTPTDTTQLGYYYNRVPTWQPNPSMMPPNPHPANFHNRSIGYSHNNHFWGHSRYRQQSYSGGYGANHPQVVYGNQGSTSQPIQSTCPTCQNGSVGDSNSYPTPVEKASPKKETNPASTPEPSKAPPKVPYDEKPPMPAPTAKAPRMIKRTSSQVRTSRFDAAPKPLPILVKAPQVNVAPKPLPVLVKAPQVNVAPKPLPVLTEAPRKLKK